MKYRDIIEFLNNLDFLKKDHDNFMSEAWSQKFFIHGTFYVIKVFNSRGDGTIRFYSYDDLQDYFSFIDLEDLLVLLPEDISIKFIYHLDFFRRAI